MEVGEELKYKVYFGFIPLGEVTFKVNTTYAENGKNHYTAKAQIKSLEDIPFVNVNYIFESVMVLDEVDKEKLSCLKDLYVLSYDNLLSLA